MVVLGASARGKEVYGWATNILKKGFGYQIEKGRFELASEGPKPPPYPLDDRVQLLVASITRIKTY